MASISIADDAACLAFSEPSVAMSIFLYISLCILYTPLFTYKKSKPPTIIKLLDKFNKGPMEIVFLLKKVQID